MYTSNFRTFLKLLMSSFDNEDEDENEYDYSSITVSIRSMGRQNRGQRIEYYGHGRQRRQTRRKIICTAKQIQHRMAKQYVHDTNVALDRNVTTIVKQSNACDRSRYDRISTHLLNWEAEENIRDLSNEEWNERDRKPSKIIPSVNVSQLFQHSRRLTFGECKALLKARYDFWSFSKLCPYLLPTDDEPEYQYNISHPKGVEGAFVTRSQSSEASNAFVTFNFSKLSARIQNKIIRETAPGSGVLRHSAIGDLIANAKCIVAAVQYYESFETPEESNIQILTLKMIRMYERLRCLFSVFPFELIVLCFDYCYAESPYIQ